MCVCTERGESERTASLTLNSIAYSKTSYALDSTNRNARHSSSHVRTPATCGLHGAMLLEVINFHGGRSMHSLVQQAAARRPLCGCGSGG